MKLFLLAFFLLSGVAMISSSYGQDTGAQTINIPAMMEEVKTYIPTVREHSPFVTSIIEKHIPIGADEEDVVAAFKAAGFEARDDTEADFNKNKKKEYDKFLHFRAEFSLFPKFMWGHVIGVSVHFKNGKTAFRSGRVFYDSPILKYLP